MHSPSNVIANFNASSSLPDIPREKNSLTSQEISELYINDVIPKKINLALDDISQTKADHENAAQGLKECQKEYLALMEAQEKAILDIRETAGSTIIPRAAAGIVSLPLKVLKGIRNGLGIAGDIMDGQDDGSAAGGFLAGILTPVTFPFALVTGLFSGAANAVTSDKSKFERQVLRAMTPKGSLSYLDQKDRLPAIEEEKDHKLYQVKRLAKIFEEQQQDREGSIEEQKAFITRCSDMIDQLKQGDQTAVNTVVSDYRSRRSSSPKQPSDAPRGLT